VSQRRVNVLLWAAAGSCTVGAVAAIVLGLFAPLQSASINSSRIPAHGRAESVASRGMPPLPAFEPIFAALERPPSTDAQPPDAVVTAQPAPAVTESDRPPLTLVGTIGQSLALLRNDRGDIEIKAVGETAGGTKVLSIQKSRVEVQHNGRSIVLEKPKEPNAGS
jgi:hypothetical protein